MKKLLVTIFLGVSVVLTAEAQTFYGTTDLKTFREGRDKEFRSPRETPLLQEDFQTFKGLLYFETDTRFAVKARLEKTSDEQFFMMPNSSGTSTKFIKYGVLTFELEGRSRTLTVYRSEVFASGKYPEYKDLLFVPFRDLTNGKETYGAGRYLDIRIPAGEEVLLNFNLAYNPNCAYGSDRYACPLAPRENFLQVKITAGEKAFPHFAKKQ